jgi:3-hydroxy-9,10-secoandrosta-1,3,5(10)-triene-9,17-dione monooxygenase reductase component
VTEQLTTVTGQPQEASVFDAAQFRRVMGHFPTGVVVVTALGANRAPAGLVVGSFASVSLDPPLVGFFVDRSSTSWPTIAETGRFCVNVLAEDQQQLCRKFAVSGGRKFEGLPWRLSPLGSPVLDGVLAWLDCRLASVSDAGDHLAVLGTVRELSVPRDGKPLLFFKGGFPRLA